MAGAGDCALQDGVLLELEVVLCTSCVVAGARGGVEEDEDEDACFGTSGWGYSLARKAAFASSSVL